MKTTYPKSFKARRINSGTIVRGILTTNGCGDYGIAFGSRVDISLSLHAGEPIIISTLQWLCANCETWNINADTVCIHCNLKLGR